MKIVYCIPSCHNSGGMERVLSVKANYLAQCHDITIITTSQHNKEPYFTFSSNIKLIDLDINYDDLENLSPYKKIFYLSKKKALHKKRLKTVLHSIKADIVVSLFTHEISFLYKIKDGSSKLLELHFSKYFRNLDDKYNNANILKKTISRLLNYRDFNLTKKYNKFIVLTQEDKLDWKGLKNIDVIPNPISFSSNIKTDYHSKEVIAAGRLCPQKGFDLMIKIWSKLNKDIQEQWHLTIYGSGPDEKLLQELIYSYNLEKNITLHAPVKNITHEYLNSSIFCFTSRYEGFGMTLAEAMSCGLACISFDCPCGPSEIIDHQNGILIKSFDINSFVSKLEQLMQDESLRKNIGEKAYYSIRSQFSLEKIMQKWLNVFNDLKK
ncbi:MAG TPA: glycosyltransferase family 4 protein [Candidatus Coprenecus stercoravium]|uniref:Glycosyltransferase family 4 protein n=1 Tax=Candidatus Coprenecus stercoravium TaxID=2840735 RepID=A0A9D2GPI8_9BACT|nr:glycosyltransferase family 4 protein [Candidatus Coprenecus stercoravium]